MPRKPYRKYRTAANSNRQPMRWNVERYDISTDTLKVVAWARSEQAACNLAHRGCTGREHNALLMSGWQGTGTEHAKR